MTTQRFSVTLEKSGRKTWIVLPFDPNQVWGEKQRHDVTGTVNGVPVRGALFIDGERYTLPLGPAWLRDAGLAAGAQVEVELAPEGPQAGELAPDINAVLGTDPQALVFFNSLPTFYRKNYIRWVESAKRADTRAARIQELLELLRAGKRER